MTSNSSDRPSEENSSEEQGRILILAQRTNILFGFCAELIPDIDLLEKAAKVAGDRESMAMSAAPILGAAGKDYEQVNFEWGLRRRRSEALANLLKVLRDTEMERTERAQKGQDLDKIANDIIGKF
jgi:hypothetical protein